MSAIVIGKAEGKKIVIDRKILMTTRLLVIADSGGGKTWALKRLIEQSFGQVGIIIIDPEGEFSPLRAKLDFFLVGKGGDTPADIRTAEKVAHTLLNGRASAVCDIYDMKASERHIWVQRFLDALIDAPKHLRYPYFVIVDEAHMFCPEHGKGESVASDAMIALANRGRKRMLCGIFASVRAAMVSKDLTGMCLNRLVGPTFESVNQKRAVEELGVEKSDQSEFRAKIKMLEPGNFYALGRAITKELKLVHVGPINTPHGQEALKYELKPPPPTEKVREWLVKLGDLPKQAEEEARTAAEFKKQIRELKGQLRNAPVATKEVAVSDPRAIERAIRPLRALLEEAMKFIVKVSVAGFEKGGVDEKQLMEIFKQAGKEIVRLSNSSIARKNAEFEVLKKETHRLLAHMKQALGKETTVNLEIRKNEPVSIIPHRPDPPRPSPPVVMANGDLKGPEKRILAALGQLRAIGKERPPKNMVAAWSGYSPVGGAFGNPIGKLRSNGYIDYPQPGTVELTDAGKQIVGPCSIPSHEEIMSQIRAICDGPEWKILNALLEFGKDETVSKPDLAARAGYEPVGGAFGNPIGALRTKGLLDYPRPGMVKATDWLFEV